MRVVVSLVASAALLSGCATSPTKISAAYVSPTTYQNLTCHQIDTEIMAVDTKANELYHRLKRRSSNDSWAMGVGLLVAWPALLFLSGGNGPQAGEYASLKGQKDALIEARRHCEDVQGTRTLAGDIPGTLHYGRVTLVPATTPSGMCIIAPADYVGTGAKNMPAVTTTMPRCDSFASR
ncbi:hypothetical protein LZ016_01995 [Sphingomonas sp. SM33]|uniref:Lipoprotein n=1 Tax=Sphingomonas telluris TaxID=2907998 RepID=A0ABS9VIR8_9SPHN|nr:hypothetical protein [Sphingomonas telluris]MCH8614878.1 hypothetical protein [Sphingomonas telluris]